MMRALAMGVLATVLLSVAACDDGPTAPEQASYVEVAPDSVELELGQTHVLVATVFGPGGRVLHGRSVVWSSDEAAVASIDSAGVVTAHAAGAATVRATSEGKWGTATILVREEETPPGEEPGTDPPPTVASVTVRPAFVVTYVGLTSDLTVTLRDQDGNVVDGPVVWTSSSPAVASVDSAGRVSGLSEGAAVITASSGEASATVAVSFRTTSSYHLVYDRDEPAFLWLDLRTGVAAPTLTHAAGMRATDPSPSPTRSGLAYALDNGAGGPTQIAIQNWSGTTYRFLAAGDQPAWSPDGYLIAYRGMVGGRPDIWVTHADGTTSPVNLTNGLPVWVESERPAWSPTGDRIVFAASDTLGLSHLWIMNANGTGLQQLTNSLYSDTEPAWFGGAIVFTRRNAVGSDLWRVDLGTGQPPRQLSHSGQAGMAAWSPDGAWIAFVVREPADGLGDIMVMRPDGSDVRPLSLRSDGPDGGGLNPAWTIHY
jgi:Tol biopolymer transport system component